jgi:hypothetical protein
MTLRRLGTLTIAIVDTVAPSITEALDTDRVGNVEQVCE